MDYRTICKTCNKVSTMDNITWSELIEQGKITALEKDKQYGQYNHIDGFEECEIHKYEAKQQELMKELRSNGFTCETSDEDLSISFSLSRIHMFTVWAEITDEEVRYQADNE